MNYNIYDFDKTIYQGDSSIDFYFYALRKHFFRIICYFPSQMYGAFQYTFKKIDKTAFKSKFFIFIKSLEVEKEVLAFWEKKRNKIYPWYLKQKKETDIIISASPEFLIAPICQSLGISNIVATKMRSTDGTIIGRNCHGSEKVTRLLQEFPKIQPNQFYSDSLSDTPLAQISQTPFLIKKGKSVPWPKV